MSRTTTKARKAEKQADRAAERAVSSANEAIAHAAIAAIRESRGESVGNAPDAPKAAEKAGSFEVDKVKEAAKGLKFDTPEGLLTVSDWNQHVYKTARIGVINSDGLIDEVWSSGEPIEPDPCLENYDWAEGLAQGECDQ